MKNPMSRERFFDDPGVITEEAFNLIAEAGYENFSIRKVASRLGVSPMTLYNYFPNLEALLKATVVYAFNHVLMTMQAELGCYFDHSGKCPLRVFPAIGYQLLDLMQRQPNVYKFLFMTDLKPFYNDKTILNRYEFAFRKTAEHLLDPSKEQELHQHVYLFEVLINALVRSIFMRRAPVNEENFRLYVELAYDRLLKPFEPCFGGECKHEDRSASCAPQDNPSQ